MPRKTESPFSQSLKPFNGSKEKRESYSPGSSSSTSATHTHPAANQPTTQAEKNPKTRIVIKYNVGFNNALYLRGNSCNLSWEKGTPLKNVKADEWMWETELPFSTCEFKVLINDKQYEAGDNHRVVCGSTIHYTPRF